MYRFKCEEKTPECLADFLENYEFRVTVSASTRLETSCDFYINLKDMKNYDTFEDLIYDNSTTIDFNTLINNDECIINNFIYDIVNKGY